MLKDQVVSLLNSETSAQQGLTVLQVSLLSQNAQLEPTNLMKEQLVWVSVSIALPEATVRLQDSQLLQVSVTKDSTALEGTPLHHQQLLSVQWGSTVPLEVYSRSCVQKTVTRAQQPRLFVTLVLPTSTVSNPTLLRTVKLELTALEAIRRNLASLESTEQLLPKLLKPLLVALAQQEKLVFCSEPLPITELVKLGTTVKLGPSAPSPKTTLRKEADVRETSTAQKEAVQLLLVLKVNTVTEVGFLSPLETVKLDITVLLELQDRIL